MDKPEIDWTLSASSGMMGADIDFDFFDSLSKTELLNFGLNLENVKMMYDNELKSRGI